MKPKSRVTLAQIADRARVHKSTVSLALRNSPRVNQETSRRVHQAALELGYIKDAHLSHLMGYLRTISKSEKYETIAYLTSETTNAEDLDDRPFFREFHKGAMEELDDLGYRLETFRLREYEFNYNRLSKVLQARSIQGIIVSPPVKIVSMGEISWERLTGITLGYRLQMPQLHRVVCDQVAVMRLVLSKLEEMGYRHPFFAYRKGRDSHVGRRWSIALNGSIRLFPHVMDYHSYGGEADDSFVENFHKSGCDCVIGLSYNFAVKLKDSGYSIPSDVGFVLLDRHDGPDYVSSVDQRPRSLGHIAARQMAGMLDRNEIGLPKEPYTITLDPVWHPGSTL